MSVTAALNYLVPSTGTTHFKQVSQNFVVSPLTIDFSQESNDGESFMPSGIFINNLLGTTPITVLIREIQWTISCPAGKILQTQYPAPMGQTADIYGGTGAVGTVIFVDFPVLPFIY